MVKHKLYFYLVGLILVMFTGSLYSTPIYEKLYSNILAKNTKIETQDRMKSTLVDYSSLKSSQTFKTVIRFISKFDYTVFRTKQEQISFWINVHNIAAMSYISQEFPIDTTSDLNTKSSTYKDLKIISVFNEMYSLNDIKKILFLYNDERILFTLADGDLSSPQLHQKPYTSEAIESQLNNASFDFINERFRGVDIKQETKYLYVSVLFKNHPEIFESDEKIKRFISPNFKEDLSYYKVFYLRNNKSLNAF
ncbi:hypothetical protein DID80_01560 [Candidatus Marinamargulisbacteria bacterium SCGC AAA071-K20]|nr:hypothetical protein DID80_01560 [Candidatus Marinamargulisbacteria bacterium SCGC AAA071-K20]